MDKKIYFIEPVFEAKYWGGQALKKFYGYNPDLPNIAIVYHVIALPKHKLDNQVIGTGEKLSQFYETHKELFNCEQETFPLRMESANKEKNISVQIHPTDDYALKHEGERGKVECGLFIEGDKDHQVIRGHHASTREEFRHMVETRQWDKLFRIIKVKKGQFIYNPQGTLHSDAHDPTEEEKGMIELVFETNSDITYRLYDWDRKGLKNRELHVEKVIENVNIPDGEGGVFTPKFKVKNGCTIYDFVDKPGILTSFRIQVKKEGFYERSDFMFLVCIHGEAKINDIIIKKGQTIFVPSDFGPLHITGKVDLGGVTYRNKNK